MRRAAGPPIRARAPRGADPRGAALSDDVTQLLNSRRRSEAASAYLFARRQRGLLPHIRETEMSVENTVTVDDLGASSKGLRSGFIDAAMRERRFLVLLGLMFFVAGATYDIPKVAMWVGFAIAAYSAVANDSVQTLGTFIASNQGRPWWHLWLWIGGVFLATMTYSWITYDGDVSYQRLSAKGFATAPTQFHFLHIAAPIFLLILTRLRMPVSTTFLLLSAFATTGSSIWKVTLKSISGYGIAFVCAVVVWFVLGDWMKRTFRGAAHPAWRAGQWITTALLWSVWLMQDAANVAVYLPRQLSVWEFVAFSGTIFVGLGLLFRMGGERVQQVVDEKNDVTDVRAATVIDFIYAVILYIFKFVSKMPMSTTWVFVGLLAGRELAMAVRNSGKEERSFKHAARLIGKDLLYVTIGFVVALVLAGIINPAVAEALIR